MVVPWLRLGCQTNAHARLPYCDILDVKQTGLFRAAMFGLLGEACRGSVGTNG
jgi:hypothetical protein